MDSDEFLRPSRWMIQDQIYNLSRLVVFQCWDSSPKAADSIFVFFFKTSSNGVFKMYENAKILKCNSSRKSLYVWNNAHFKCIFSIFFWSWSQPEETGLYSQLGSFWTLLLWFPDAFQCFHLLLFHFIFSSPLIWKRKIPVIFWHFNTNVPDRNAATVPRLRTKG